MIAKNIKAQSFVGCVKYVMKKDAEVLKAEGVMALSPESMITSFELQRSVRSEIKSPVGHIPISFSPEDRERMTNDFMLKLAEEYMENMNVKNTQYIVVRHHDTDNEHVHIIYNRINNNGELITDKNDYKRNVETCKKLKDKYNLTYGKGKMNVKRDKLRGSERVKHDIYHAIVTEIVQSRNMKELQNRLKKHGVEIEFKYRRGTDEVQGVSFTKDNCTFKGSQIDRMHSYKYLQEIFKLVDAEFAKVELEQKQQAKQQPKHNFKHRIPTDLGGVALSDEQRINLDNCKSVYLENVTDKKGAVYNAYVKWSEQEDKLQFYKRDPNIQQQSASQPMQKQSHQQSESFISGGMGLLDLPSDGGDDPEEDSFRRSMQLKKKKRGIKR